MLAAINSCKGKEQILKIEANVYNLHREIPENIS